MTAQDIRNARRGRRDGEDPDPQVLEALLDRLEAAASADCVSVGDLTEAIGPRSFPALMLIFALIAISPASVVPGVTTGVAAVEFLLVVQLFAGVRRLWLPRILSRRTLSGERLRAAVRWLRRPVARAGPLMRPRLQALTRRPWISPWLFMILALTLAMPFMELVPGSGTLAASCIALVAVAILARNGLILLLAGACLAGMIWLIGWVGSTLL